MRGLVRTDVLVKIDRTRAHRIEARSGNSMWSVPLQLADPAPGTSRENVAKMAIRRARSCRSRRGLPLGAAVTAGIAACGPAKCGPPNLDDGLLDTPTIASAWISPAVASMAAGTRLEMRVEALDVDGNYVWLEDHPEITVEWSGEAERDSSASSGAGFEFESAPKGWTVLRLDDDSIDRLIVTAEITWAKSSLSAAPGEVLRRVPGLPPSDEVHAIPTPAPVVGMLDGCQVAAGSLEPVHAMLEEFIAVWPLTHNLTEAGCTRPTEFAVLSTAHRMTFRDATTLQTPPPATIWTNQSGDLLRADTLSWGAPDEIDLHVYYFVPGVANPQSAGQNRVNEANDILRRNRLGIRFVAIHATPSMNTPVGSCARDHVQETLGIDLAPARLNLVFVERLSPANVGIACPPSPSGGGRVILIAWPLMSNETLAHEIGHALGHERMNLGFYHVKAGSTPGFAKTNLMHEKSTAMSREWLTTGQVFRMNVDTGSWYQHTPGIPNRHNAKKCGCEPYLEDVCPRLDRRPGQTPKTAATNYCGPAS
jgi:hypothetical protein